MIQSIVSNHPMMISPSRPIVAGGLTRTRSILRITHPNHLILSLQLQIKPMLVLGLLALLSSFNAGTSRKERRSIAALNAPEVTTTARTCAITYEASIPMVDMRVQFKDAGRA